MMKILLKCMLVAGGILMLILMPNYMSPYAVLLGYTLDEEIFLLVLFLLWMIIGVGYNFFSVFILNDYFGRKGSWFLQIPCSKKEKLTALLLVNLIFCLIYVLSLFILMPYISSLVEIDLPVDISMLIRAASLAILPIFTVIVSKEVFPKFPNFIMFLLLSQAISSIGSFLNGVHVLFGCGVILVLEILMLYFSYQTYDHHFNAGEQRCS